MASLCCHSCGATMPLDEPIGRSATCEACARDLRTCSNCRHYDPRYNNSCTEPQAELVLDKTRGNFCEFFYFSREPFAGGAPVVDRAPEARAKLASLFGPGAASEPPAADPRGASDALFRDEASLEARRRSAREKLDALFRKPDDPPDKAGS